jgi:hypothetical protein
MEVSVLLTPSSSQRISLNRTELPGQIFVFCRKVAAKAKILEVSTSQRSNQSACRKNSAA